MRCFALVTSQGTACSETVLTEDEYLIPENRERMERLCLGGPDDPVAGSWTDVTDNEALWWALGGDERSGATPSWGADE